MAKNALDRTPKPEIPDSISSDSASKGDPKRARSSESPDEASEKKTAQSLSVNDKDLLRLDFHLRAPAVKQK